MKPGAFLALVSLAATSASTSAHAGWSADPVAVHATTETCPLVAAASDGADGAIVVWQEETAADPTQHRLRAKRLFATGVVDPAWPAGGVLVSNATTMNRGALGAVGDGVGGAYVWWMEGAGLYLTRLLGDGTIAPGWTARGRGVGTLTTAGHRPRVFADGGGGIWLGWLAGAAPSTAGRIAHLGPAGTGVNGWPNGSRAYAPSTVEIGGRLTTTFAFAPAPDGGAWIAWGDVVVGEAGFEPGSWRVQRTTPAGLVVPGWDPEGVAVREFHGERLGTNPWFSAALVAVAADGASGLYLLAADVLGEVGNAVAPPRLHRLDGAAAPVSTWPSGGVLVPATGLDYASDGGANYSLRLDPASDGGVFAIRPTFFSHGSGMFLVRFSPTAAASGWGGAEPYGFEALVPPSGDTYLASCWPSGPYGPYQPNAYVALDQTAATGAKGPGYLEWHSEPVITWYGDVGLAPTSGGGAILVWSQVRERFGLFARRFTPAGEVTGVPTVAAGTRTMTLRFVVGRGVVVRMDGAARSRVRLHDVSGRIRAEAELPAGAREVVFAGTASLAPGLYFARAISATGEAVTGRVVVRR